MRENRWREVRWSEYWSLPNYRSNERLWSMLIVLLLCELQNLSIYAQANVNVVAVLVVAQHLGMTCSSRMMYSQFAKMWPTRCQWMTHPLVRFLPSNTLIEKSPYFNRLIGVSFRVKLTEQRSLILLEKNQENEKPTNWLDSTWILKLIRDIFYWKQRE